MPPRTDNIAEEGRSLKLIWAEDESGDFPGLKFYRDLDVRDRAGLHHLFKWMAGDGKIVNDQKFKDLEGTKPKLFEFKKQQVRIFCAFINPPPHTLLLLTGCVTKKGKTPHGEIPRAHKLLERYTKGGTP